MQAEKKLFGNLIKWGGERNTNYSIYDAINCGKNECRYKSRCPIILPYFLFGTLSTFFFNQGITFSTLPSLSCSNITCRCNSSILICSFSHMDVCVWERVQLSSFQLQSKGIPRSNTAGTLQKPNHGSIKTLFLHVTDSNHSSHPT